MRISLSMRLDDTPDQRQAQAGRERNSGGAPPRRAAEPAKGAGALGEALLAAMRSPQKGRG
jgi:uncharacterized protein